jgi:hypothetical protein
MLSRRGWVACVFLGLGCSAPPSFIGPATKDANAGEDANASASTACTNLATAECAELESCSDVLLQTRYGSVATCESRLKESCERSLEAPSTGNSPQKAEACAQAYPTWSCLDYLGNTNLPSSCEQPTGALANGSACAFAAQCTTGFCAIAPQAACGTCAPLPQTGETCANLSSCGPHLQCLPVSKVCGTLGLSGARCSKGAPCGAHLSCVGADSATSTAGTCQASATVAGSRCDPALVKGPGCDFDGALVCNAQSKTCEPLTISAGGGPCDADDHQFATCAASGTCSTSEAGATGTCTSAAADSEACTTSGDGPGCLAPARCITTSSSATTGTCQDDGSTSCK